ncbi:MAG: DUF6385 domain-containing protein [Tissierellia bacterium]|nr:DUF6385 domain-containing protein [Tissierellia bacterium]MDD3751992.1 DUF6385 domain-containing protein [Tissierellia bacterium]
MPGMPIFQDSPSQLKGQIYVLNSTTQSIVPLQVDNTGNLAVNGTVNLASGAEVTLASGTDIDNVASVTTLDTITNDVKIINGTTALDIDTVSTLDTITNDVKIVNGTTALTVGLAAGTDIDNVTSVTTLDTITNDVKIVNGSTNLTVGLAADTDIDTVSTLDTITNDVKIVNGSTALNVGLSTGTNIIGKVENQLVFTNVDSFGESTPLQSKAVGISATVTADSQDVSQESSYNWFIKNTGTDSADQNITLKVELSPDGTNWLEDTGSTISVPYNTAKMITVTNFLQYVRFVITGGAAATTVISCFQAQH